MSNELTPLGTRDLPTKCKVAAEMRVIEEGMNPALRKATEGVRDWFAKGVKQSLRRIWNLGKKLRKITANERKYGSRAVEKISLLVGYHKSVLAKAMRFHEAFDDEELADLLETRTSLTRSMLSLAHVEQLFKLTDKDMRKSLLEACAENEWTPEEFTYHVAVAQREKIGEAVKPHAGGRPVRVPTTIVQLLHNFEKASGTLVRNDPLMYDHPMVNFIRYVDDLPADKVTPELLAKLDECSTSADLAMRVLAKIKPQLMEARVKAERKMQAQSERQGVIDAEIVVKEVKLADAEGAPPKVKNLGHKVAT